MRWARVVLVVGLLGVLLVATPSTAHACSCAPGGAPVLDVTAVAVADLGYIDGDGGQQHAWRLEVIDGRRGAATGETIRISMVVGQWQQGDLTLVTGCGMDDNLTIGESYDIISVTFEGMVICGSSVIGARSPVPDRGGDTSGRWVAAAAATAAIVVVVGAVAMVGRSRRESS